MWRLRPHTAGWSPPDALPDCGARLLVGTTGGGDGKAGAADGPDAAVPTLGRGELVTADAADSALLSEADGSGDGICGDGRHQLGKQATIGAPRALVATLSDIVTGHLLDHHPSGPSAARGSAEPEEADPATEVLHGVAAVRDAGDVDLPTWLAMEDISAEAVEDTNGLRLTEAPSRHPTHHDHEGERPRVRAGVGDGAGGEDLVEVVIDEAAPEGARS